MRRQRPELRWRFDVAGEQDHAGRRMRTEQRRFARSQSRPGETNDCSFQNSATEQAAPFARTRSQNAVAWATSLNPPVRRRHSV
jgi:hypothetical protein